MHNDEFRSERWKRKGDVRRLSYSAVAVGLVLFAAAGMLTSFAGTPQQPRTPTQDAAGVKRLGAVSFPVSCAPSVQADFNRAVALLHSFQYEIAEQAFAEVAQKDPQCAMAHWGRALSLYHPVWEWPESETIQKGHSYIQRAEELGAKTARERGYIRAASIFYQDSTSMKVADRATAYCNALAGLHDEFPEDHNAAALYALSLITSPGSCPTAGQGEQRRQSEQQHQGAQAAGQPQRQCGGRACGTKGSANAGNPNSDGAVSSGARASRPGALPDSRGGHTRTGPPRTGCSAALREHCAGFAACAAHAIAHFHRAGTVAGIHPVKSGFGSGRGKHHEVAFGKRRR